MGLQAYEGQISKGALDLTMRMFEVTKDGIITNIAVEDPDEGTSLTSVRFYELKGSRDAYTRRPICSGQAGNTDFFDYSCRLPVKAGTLIGMQFYGPTDTVITYGVTTE